jgi:hypothetical protein
MYLRAAKQPLYSDAGDTVGMVRAKSIAGLGRSAKSTRMRNKAGLKCARVLVVVAEAEARSATKERRDESRTCPGRSSA